MVKNFLKRFYPFIILLALSFALHFAYLSHPSQTVFDEVHYGKFVTSYLNHRYFFDNHPPLGKLLVFGWAELTGLKEDFDFSHIGNAGSPELFLSLRFLPALFGSIFVLLFSYLAFLITRSKKTALIAGFLILFDNAFLLQSRLILTDTFLLFFGVLTFCLFFLYQRQKSFSFKWFIILLLAGISLGLTASVKWTGLATLGIITTVLVAKIFLPGLAEWLTPSDALNPDKKNYLKYAKEAVVSFTVIIFAGFITYASLFAIHFKLIEQAGASDTFGNAGFNETVSGKQANFWQKFTELNTTMFNSHNDLKETHPFSSRWYQWPLDNKPVYYWVQNPQAGHNEISKIYFLGNPIIWLMALLFVGITCFRFFLKKERQKMKPVFYFLVFAFLANLLPFISIKRITFLYHYLPAVSFAILLLSIYLRQLWPKEKMVLFAALAAVALGFIILSPLTYGWPMAPEIDKFEMKIISFLSQNP